MGYPNTQAGSGTQGSYVPFQLFAGEKEIVTNHGPVAPNLVMKQFEVVAMNATGQLIKLDPAAADSAAVAVGVMAQAITTTAAAVPAPYYVSGFFNHEALVWPATLTTLAMRKLALVGSELQTDALYGAA